MMNNDWADMVSKLAHSKCDVIPKGWLTRRELEKILSVKRGRLAEIINGLIDANLIEEKQFTVMQSGRAMPVNHYRKK